MDSGTAAITAVEALAAFTGANMDTLKTVGRYLNKVRDRLVMAGTEKSATSMAEIDEALVAFKALADMLRLRLGSRQMEDRMLAFEKAVTKSLEEPVRKTAPQSTQGMGGRPT